MIKRLLLKKWLPRLGVGVAAGFIRLLGLTLRVKIEDREGLIAHPPPEPMLFAFWHNRILMMPLFYSRYFPKRKLAVMISASRDGTFISSVAARFGVDAARGSSSKGGAAAMRQLQRRLENGEGDAAVTPDGPRGPCYHVQPGVLRLAYDSDIAIIPVTCHYESCWRLKSWDRFIIPKPFSRCRLILLPQVRITSDQWQVEGEKIRTALGGD